MILRYSETLTDFERQQLSLLLLLRTEAKILIPYHRFISIRLKLIFHICGYHRSLRAILSTKKLHIVLIARCQWIIIFKVDLQFVVPSVSKKMQVLQVIVVSSWFQIYLHPIRNIGKIQLNCFVKI